MQFLAVEADLGFFIWKTLDVASPCLRRIFVT